MSEPQDEDHKAIWDAVHAQTDSIASLRREINLNGYVPILKEIARRYERRREVLQFFKRPLSVLSKLLWLALGATVFAIASHFIAAAK